ncbi:hypothetical protein QE152_g24535 [Popillia japonica]|uniref:Peptidase A2 domain-containing protein n=1 Tax=Popillia japonica TaxID=7064 RepID=A0AAW1KET5_POPJA
MMETPAIQLLVHECLSLALIDTGASHTLVRPKWITGPTTSIPAMQLRLAAGNQTIQADQQGTLDARTTNGVHFRCPAIPVDDLQADIIQTIQADQQGTLDARTTNGVHFRCPAIPVDDLQADIILGLPWLIEQQARMVYIFDALPSQWTICKQISSWAFRG